MRPLATAACSLVSLGLLSLAPAEVSGSEAALDRKSARLIERIDELRREARIPGLAIAVVDRGEAVVAHGFGTADVESGRPVTPDTPFNIASVTKPTSAVVLLRLVEQGVIDLDRPIAEYSDWPRFCAEFSEQPSIFARDLRCEPAVHTELHLVSHTAAGEPGERFSYNPILYSWASRPIMSATGESFSDLVHEYVIEPAGMTHSARQHRALSLPDEIAADLAPPHRLDETGDVVRAPELGAQGDGAAGGLISTAADLARFDIALDEGRLLSPESRALMMTPVRNSAGEALPYGIGWYLQEHEGLELVWHSGWWEEAYSAIYLKIPEHEVSLILLANSEGLWWGNPLDEARIEDSPFVQAFLEIWLGAGI